jgi:hypothetical protein
MSGVLIFCADTQYDRMIITTMMVIHYRHHQITTTTEKVWSSMVDDRGAPSTASYRHTMTDDGHTSTDRTTDGLYI